MTLLLRPRGRGRWNIVTMRLEGSHHVAPLLIRRGQLLPLGGVTFRIVKVLAP